MYGPFVHGLNKGGLAAILATRQLKATEARSIAGGANAVRAHAGTFEEVARKMNWLMRPDIKKIYIEFETPTQPDRGTPPGAASWKVAQFLPINVLRVLNGAGQVIK